MGSSILLLATMATAAMAACPLSVEISGTAGNVASVAVTNTGSDVITLFKGNTVLTEDPTLDLTMSDAGRQNHCSYVR